MSLNIGQVLERVVRRDRMCISELSRKLNVSRRTIYNWFDQKDLNPQIIWKVGTVIGYDFSHELPDSFPKNRNIIHVAPKEITEDNAVDDENSIYFWMNKYIQLLEEYNEVIIRSQLASAKSDKKTHHSSSRNNPKSIF